MAAVRRVSDEPGSPEGPSRFASLYRIASWSGTECIPLRLWDHQADWNAPHHLELLLIFERAKQVSFRRYVLTYRPVRYLELRACMEDVGFVLHKSDYRTDEEWYEIEGKRRD